MLSSTTKLISQGATIIGGIVGIIGAVLKMHNDYCDIVDHELDCDEEQNVIDEILNEEDEEEQ